MLVLLGGFDEWPARTKWTNEYLREKMGDATVTVASRFSKRRVLLITNTLL